ncbi:unnamed protein product [Nesidiocoris tenuis]|uniref:Uncharacterized protein n=1 Tax=Nesidiocoris tenuis TaxID=355587 RepID=A0A6H5H0G5_9HEMI|nr:unnamed protein product [Nesidiocoris tenuis]
MVLCNNNDKSRQNRSRSGRRNFGRRLRLSTESQFCSSNPKNGPPRVRSPLRSPWRTARRGAAQIYLLSPASQLRGRRARVRDISPSDVRLPSVRRASRLTPTRAQLRTRSLPAGVRTPADISNPRYSQTPVVDSPPPDHPFDRYPSVSSAALLIAEAELLFSAPSSSRNQQQKHRQQKHQQQKQPRRIVHRRKFQTTCHRDP